MRSSPAFGVACTVLLLATAFAGPASARPGIDAVASSRPRPDLVARLNGVAADPLMRRIGVPEEVDQRLGVPTIVWGSRPFTRPATAGGGRTTPELAAREHLARLAPFYGLDAGDVRGAELGYVHDTGRGGIIVTFRQRVNGIEVFRDEVKILMDRRLDFVAASGYVPGRALVGERAPAFRLPVERAVARAIEDFDGVPGAVLRSKGPAPGGYERFDQAGPQVGASSLGPLRAKKVLFHLADRLEPGWYVEVASDTAAYAYVVSADDGSILFRASQVANDAFTYRVWADPAGLHLPMDSPEGNGPTPDSTGVPDYFVPPYVSSGLVTLQNGPISTNDPWLAPGATVTTGNNVDAYADITAPDGYNAGDVRPTTTSANTFDRAFDTTLDPGSSTSQQMAAVTQMFYDTNFLHDWFYDSGFNEAAGNAQSSNYGRGGIDGDPMHAEGQDNSGTNNANMYTPADGASPRMQMYVFNAPGLNKLTVNSPPAIAGDMYTGTATFGPQAFSVTADLVLVNDGTGTPTDGCEPFLNSVAGKIALIDRGSCTFTSKVEKAQAEGAVGVIIVNNVAGDPPPAMGGTPSTTITIPTLSITTADGDLIKAQLGGGVSATMTRDPEVARDGTIDNMVVAHEWGHYLSNRLIGNGSGLNTHQAAGMGEGWSDFIALLMTVRPEDALVASNPDFSGVYAVGAYATGSLYPSNAAYFGIRRVPYSTDFSKNALTFQHIQNGVPLPAGPPTAFGSDGATNSEVHNTGEVWCTMLWECYASLLADPGRLSFVEARDRMRDYLVAAFEMTPVSPTFVEARDAMLAAALAKDPQDFTAFWQAFALRGIGMGAVAPDRYSTDNVGVVESYDVGGNLSFVSGALSDDVHSCDDDGYLDDGEIGNLVVTLANTGATPLSATTATVTSTNPAVTFLSGNQIHFPASSPNGTTVGHVQILLQGAVGLSAMDLHINYDDPGLLVPGPRPEVETVTGNANETPSTLETVEAHTVPWTMTSAPGSADEPWRVISTPSEHLFYAPDPGAVADLYLTTPPLDVAPSGDFNFTFEHAYKFETSDANYDGGVIEITTNGGASWTDIGGSATPGYNGVVYLGSGNPLASRAAFVNTSPSYPNLNSVTVDLGTAYAGQTVQVRWRLGADEATGDFGWEVDSIQVNNITNQPFLELIADPNVCSLAGADPAVPRELDFSIAGPNPVVGRADFRFALPAQTRVSIAVYDVSGRRVATVADGTYDAGIHTASWSGASKAGVYFARMSAGGREFTRRIVMLH